MIKNKFFDDLETRSVNERNNDHLKKLNYLIKIAKNNKNQSLRFDNTIETLKDCLPSPEIPR